MGFHDYVYHVASTRGDTTVGFMYLPYKMRISTLRKASHLCIFTALGQHEAPASTIAAIRSTGVLFEDGEYPSHALSATRPTVSRRLVFSDSTRTPEQFEIDLDFLEFL